jgi:hypothetical protein
MRPNLYHPKAGLVVTITIKFLDKYRMQLCTKHRTHDSITTKTNPLLQSLCALLNTINKGSDQTKSINLALGETS